ncbi:hypothetical protein diail_5949 [Diaporthe ilicicola]|nr:hypothetical protein diail_5949 [Diaporthe ilicicola]
MASTSKLNLRLALPRPEFLQPKRSRQERLPPTPPTPEEKEEAQLGDQESGGSAQDATEWILNTIREQGHWEEHLSLIRIDCSHNMAELRQLGQLSKSDGTKECQKMIRMPVLYDEIGCFLWEKLAAIERGPDFERQDEEKAAEYAREVSSRAQQALDERFRFDPPPLTPTSGNSRRAGRARQDSEPISPKHIKQSQAESPLQPGRSTSHGCHFCNPQGLIEQRSIPDDVRAEAPSATRGRVLGRSSASRVPRRARPQTSRSSSLTKHPAAFFNHSRRTSHSSSLLWQRDPHPSLAWGARSGSGSSSSGASVESRRFRDGGIAGRVGSVVGNLGKGVATAIGGGLSHGYSYGGRTDRSASSWTV